jgi:hypothetical protein
LTERSDCIPLHISVKFVTLEAMKTLIEGGVALNYIHKHADVSLTWYAGGAKKNFSLRHRKWR